MTENSNFFVVSCHGNVNVNWIENIPYDSLHVLLKDKISINIPDDKISKIENVGYNIYSYMKFIVDNYENLPETVVFCKNNVFPRHVSEYLFHELSSRKVFTAIEDPSSVTFQYPVTMLSSDNGFLELNTSWYVPYQPTKYFSDFNAFYRFIFDHKDVPRYLRFAPGGNYVVPRQNILLRSKEFYQNLMSFVAHDQLSGESHLVERALYIIWNSTVKESSNMKNMLTVDELQILQNDNKKKIGLISKIRVKTYIYLISFADKITGKIFN